MKTTLPAICDGGYASLALKSDGTVWAWGGGLLGDGTKRRRNYPIQVQGLSEVTAIAAGQALKKDGTIWIWGENAFGGCGIGTRSRRYILAPERVKNLDGITAISRGMAVREDGTVWVWGWNEYGQLGDGTTENRYTPVQVQSLDGVVAVANGCKRFSLALREDGTVWEWGKNGVYDGYNMSTRQLVRLPTPEQVPGLHEITAISAHHNAYALKKDGTVWAWGSNNIGQLGNGTTTNSASPVQVKDLDNVVAISAGSAHALALRKDGTVWAWGSNSCGMLGNGIAMDYDMAIKGYPPNPIPLQVQNLSDVVAIAGGTIHSLALKSDGTVWAWGSNELGGQLGDGTFVDKHIPVQVVGTKKKGFLNLFN